MTTTTVRLSKTKSELTELQARAEDTLRQVRANQKELESLIGLLRSAVGQKTPRPGPLDEVQQLVQATEDLRTSNGNLSAELIAKVYGVSLSELAGWLRKSRQTVSKTPDADALQAPLGYFERVARLRAVVKTDAGFRKWLRTANDHLDNESPLELLRKGEWQVLTDYVDDLLTGSPG